MCDDLLIRNKRFLISERLNHDDQKCERIQYGIESRKNDTQFICLSSFHCQSLESKTKDINVKYKKKLVRVSSHTHTCII